MLGMGPLQNTVHGTKHFAGCQTLQGGKKNRDYIIQKADTLSSQGPTALFAIHQGVFAPCDRFHAKFVFVTSVDDTVFFSPVSLSTSGYSFAAKFAVHLALLVLV